jgi:hypothetical protein
MTDADDRLLPALPSAVVVFVEEAGSFLLLAFFYRKEKFSIARSFFTRFGQIFFSRLSANNFPTFGQTRIWLIN